MIGANYYELECECVPLDEYLDIACFNCSCIEYNEDFTPDEPWGGPWNSKIPKIFRIPPADTDDSEPSRDLSFTTT